MTTTSLRLPSFAKINWRLRILGKRPDGYHEVFTILQTVSLCDELTFNLREDGKLTLVCDDPQIPSDSTNLIIRAARALQERIGGAFGADIKLIKRIPTQAGLGGASSNAAVTLIGLNGLWEDQLRLGDLQRLAEAIGADVPFFTVGGTCTAFGIGTKLLAAEERHEYLIIITPNAVVSTAKAYAALKAGALTVTDEASILSSSFGELNTSESDEWPLHNDFERVIFEIEPEIGRVKGALLETGARGALLAGSGSSVFGVFADKTARDIALSELRCEAGWRVFPCETLRRAEYYSAMSSSGFPLFLRSLKTAKDTGA